MGDCDCDCDCGDCDCGDCCDCDCGDCCDCKFCKECCNLFSAFTCAQCCNDFLEFLCCEGDSCFNDRTDNRTQRHHQQRRQQQNQLQQPPYPEPTDFTPINGELEDPAHPSAPPPSYDEVVRDQPLPAGFQPAVTTQPGYAADPPISNV